MQSSPCAHYENVWGSGGVYALILHQDNVCGGWSASRPGRLTPKEGAPDAGLNRRAGPCEGEEMND